MKVSRTLLKNDDTLLEFRRTWRFLTGAGFGCVLLMTISLSFKCEKKSVILKVSGTLLKNDDTAGVKEDVEVPDWGLGP